jgi:hypothetical protein
MPGTWQPHYQCEWPHLKGRSILGDLQLHNFASCSIYIFNSHGAVIVQSVKWLATGWMIRILGFDSRWGLWIFLFTTASRTALGPTQPPIQWVKRALSQGVKRPGREADHLPPLSPTRLLGIVLSEAQGICSLLSAFITSKLSPPPHNRPLTLEYLP